MLKTIALIVAAGIVVVLILASLKPDTFRIERSALIPAPPEKVYPLIADMRAFNTWNPFLRKDPKAQLTYSGPASGTGAAYGWVGTESGIGRMEVAEAVPSSRVAFKLDFIKPFEAHNRAVFTLAPQGSSTQVTWAMEGPMNFGFKVMTVFFDMDKTVGKDFADGLDNLKVAATKP
jgi:uncharacterized protein YndB with AHSA1/START domain